MSYENLHPYGMNPTEKVIEQAVTDARVTYEAAPETTCCSKAECCNAGCPNMYYSEFLSIRRGAVDLMPKEKRLDLTIECVKRYLQNQRKPKPCVFLGKDNLCTVYNVRHLKCRTYGLIPPSLYDWIVGSVSMETGIPKEQLPLCNQCQLVHVKPAQASYFPNDQIPEVSIKNMEKRLREIDRSLGMKKEFQDEGKGFYTYHDWHLLFEFGEGWLENLTQLRIKLNDAQKEQFVEALKSALEKRLAEEATAANEGGDYFKGQQPEKKEEDKNE